MQKHDFQQNQHDLWFEDENMTTTWNGKRIKSATCSRQCAKRAGRECRRPPLNKRRDANYRTNHGKNVNLAKYELWQLRKCSLLRCATSFVLANCKTRTIWNGGHGHTSSSETGGRTRNGVRVRRAFLRHLRRSHIARINALSNPTKGSQLKIGSGIEKYSGNANNNT